MSVFERFRTWLSGLFGGSTTADAETEPDGIDASDATEPAYRCSVCNTPVADPDGECSLCGATDLTPIDESTADRETDTGLDPDAIQRDSGTAPDVEVARLRAIRAEAILGEHPGRWECIDDDQFRVHVADGEHVVDSASEVAELLRESKG